MKRNEIIDVLRDSQTTIRKTTVSTFEDIKKYCLDNDILDINKDEDVSKEIRKYINLLQSLSDTMHEKAINGDGFIYPPIG